MKASYLSPYSFLDTTAPYIWCSTPGEFHAGIDIPSRKSLDQLETNLDGHDKILFLQFVSKMLQWDPQKRQTPGQLLEDEWLKKRRSILLNRPGSSVSNIEGYGLLLEARLQYTAGRGTGEFCSTAETILGEKGVENTC